MRTLFRREKYISGIVLICCLVLGSTGVFSKAVLGQEGTSPLSDVRLLKGDLETVKVFGLERIAITNPEIADIVKVEDDQVTMVGLQPGQTTLLTWDKYGKRATTIRVFDVDLSIVKTRIESLIRSTNIKGINLEINDYEGKVVVSGDLVRENKVVLEKLLEPFGSNVLNLLKEVTSQDLIQIDAQIAEISTSFTKKMGIDWTNSSALTFTEVPPGIPIDKPQDVFRIGEFQRTTIMENILNFIITEGKGKVLSRPKLVVSSGQDATIQVGGQVPIATRTITNDNIVENIIYQEYGVNMKVTPTLKDNKKIEIKLNVTISDIDSSTPVKDKVAFTNRVAQTQLYLEDRQTIILAGLLKSNKGENMTRLPVLSEIPIIGAIFRNRINSPDTDLELVITLTPSLLTQDGVMKKMEEISSEELEKKFSSNTGQGQKMYNTDNTIVSEVKVPYGVENKVKAASSKSAKKAEQFNKQANASATKSRSIKEKGKNKKLKAEDYLTKNVSVSSEMAGYVRSVQEQIAKNVSYPDEAQSAQKQGTVKLSVRILKDGTLAEAFVKESSGYTPFDDSALKTTQMIAPYAPFPSELDLKDITFTIPIVYHIGK